jgi:hypothetical protein
MPMEYLIVRCSQERSVLIGGIDHGKTDEMIELEGGTYTVTLKLEPGDGCLPTCHEVKLLNTTAINPCEVTFALA